MSIDKNIYIKIREALTKESRHMTIPQMGAAVIATNSIGDILLLKKGAYNDIPQEFINYHLLKKIRGIESLDTILKIVKTWFQNPYMLFRNCTIYYFIKEFQKYE